MHLALRAGWRYRTAMLLFARGTLVLDGGLGTELLRAHPGALQPGEVETWNLAAPERVLAAHARFLEAGADAILANTFCALGPYLAGSGERAVELARAGGELAVRAARAQATPERPRYALGTLGPAPGGARAGAPFDAEAVREIYAAPAAALAESGVDGIVLETARDERVALAALEALCGVRARAGRELALIVSWSVDRAGRLATGTPVERACEALDDHALALIALNCSFGPSSLTEPLRRIARATSARLGAWPSAGVPRERGAPPAIGPAEFAAWHAERQSELDLALAGGCCGAGPLHVAALAAALAR